jgi:hypothetical protein
MTFFSRKARQEGGNAIINIEQKAAQNMLCDLCAKLCGKKNLEPREILPQVHE